MAISDAADAAPTTICVSCICVGLAVVVNTAENWTLNANVRSWAPVPLFIRREAFLSLSWSNFFTAAQFCLQINETNVCLERNFSKTDDQFLGVPRPRPIRVRSFGRSLVLTLTAAQKSDEGGEAKRWPSPAARPNERQIERTKKKEYAPGPCSQLTISYFNVNFLMNQNISLSFFCSPVRPSIRLLSDSDWRPDQPKKRKEPSPVFCRLWQRSRSFVFVRDGDDLSPLLGMMA